MMRNTVAWIVVLIALLGSAVVRAQSASGDQNGDGVATTADVFFLVQHLFAGGPSPKCVPAPVPRSGQTSCFNGTFAVACDSTTKGQDGETQHGVVWPAPRFVDNGDGTVADHLTGLVWLKKVDCFATSTWTGALAAANSLAAPNCGLTDGSVSGEWRVPNVNELRSLLDLSRSPAISFEATAVFQGIGATGDYWSSTTYAYVKTRAWEMSLEYGVIGPSEKTVALYHVWPVRDPR